jgi:geranylgeranyl diphosphate synthase type II
VGQDAAHGRPSAVRELGLRGAVARLTALADSAAGAVPECPGREQLAALIRHEARRLLPKSLPVTAT